MLGEEREEYKPVSEPSALDEKEESKESRQILTMPRRRGQAHSGVFQVTLLSLCPSSS